MENKIVPFLSIGFVNANGNKFSVHYGHMENDRNPMCKVTGSHIPFPVFAGTWFRGIPESQMERSLSEIGYVKYARVNLLTGAIQVFDVSETETENIISDDRIESVSDAIKHAWTGGYSGWAYRLMDVYTAIGGTETMENIISGVDFGSETIVRFDEELLLPHQFDALVKAIRIAKANGYAGVVDDLYSIYGNEKKGDVKSLDEILSIECRREMSIDDLNNIKGLREATRIMVSETERTIAPIKMVADWTNCSLCSARAFVYDVRKENHKN